MLFKSRNRALLLLILLFIEILLIAASSNNVSAEEENDIANPQLTVITQIYEIDQDTKTTDIQAIIGINDFPWNKTSVLVLMTSGDQYVLINCTLVGQQDNGLWSYSGVSNRTICMLDGSGDFFPFDFYMLHLKIRTVEYIGNDSNYTVSISQDRTTAYFTGPQWYSLKNDWKTVKDELAPINIYRQEVTISIERSDNIFKLDFLVFLVPVIASYYFLGATFLIDPATHLSERLTVYVSLFFFVPVFLIGIQGFFPFRSSISFPELLLINLLVTTAVMTICSIVGKFKASLNRNPETKPQIKWDQTGISASLVILFLLYAFAVPELSPQPSFLVVYGIVPAYVFWTMAKVDTFSWTKSKNCVAAFIIGFPISVYFYIFALFAPLFQAIWPAVAFVGAFFAGAVLGFYVRSRGKSMIAGFVSGVIWSIFSGAFIGTIFNSIGVATGTITLGLFGAFFSPFSMIGAFVGNRICTWWNQRKHINANRLPYGEHLKS